MAGLLAHFPWWISAFLVLIGLILLAYGNQRRLLNVRAGGLAVVSLALLLGAARFLIDTPVERCERRTRQMVEAADQKDWKKLQSLVDADTVVDLGSVEKGAKGAEIGKRAEQLATKVGLTEVATYELTSDQIPGKIIVKFIAAYKVNTTGDVGHPSGWEFDYVPAAGQGETSRAPWDLQRIKLLTLEGQTLQ